MYDANREYFLLWVRLRWVQIEVYFVCSCQRGRRMSVAVVAFWFLGGGRGRRRVALVGAAVVVPPVALAGVLTVVASAQARGR